MYTDERLNLSKPGKALEESQGFKPDPGNLAVRDYRGLRETSAIGGTVTVLQSKEQERKPLTYSGTHPNSIPVAPTSGAEYRGNFGPGDQSRCSETRGRDGVSPRNARNVG